MTMHKITVSLFVACALQAGFVVAADEHLSAKSIAPALTCESKPTAPTVALLGAAMARHGVTPSTAYATWAKGIFPKFGLNAEVPAGVGRAEALRAAALSHRGLVVSAKLAQEVGAANPAYAASPFYKSMNAFLGASMQPVAHGNRESGKRDDLDDASDNLIKAIARVGNARSKVGALYSDDAVRFYLLGHAFDDVVAVEVATGVLCRKELSVAKVAQISAGAKAAKAQ